MEGTAENIRGGIFVVLGVGNRNIFLGDDGGVVAVLLAGVSEFLWNGPEGWNILYQ